jgi:hypothetical protein
MSVLTDFTAPIEDGTASFIKVVQYRYPPRKNCVIVTSTLMLVLVTLVTLITA